MKLLTHNMLACTAKGVQNGFPLKIEAQEVVEREADFDPGARCARRAARRARHAPWAGRSGWGPERRGRHRRAAAPSLSCRHERPHVGIERR
jgi:hypothetical protein